MADDLLWLVRLFQIFHLFIRQALPTYIARLINASNVAESYNWNGPFLDNPNQRNLTHLPSLLFSQFLHTFDYCLVFICQLPRHYCSSLRRRPCCASAQWPREMTSEQWCPGD